MYHREILVSEYRNARQEQHEGTVPSLYGFVKQDKCVAEYDQWHGLRIINATHVILCGRGLEMDENRCVGATWRLTLALLWEVSTSLHCVLHLDLVSSFQTWLQPPNSQDQLPRVSLARAPLSFTQGHAWVSWQTFCRRTSFSSWIWLVLWHSASKFRITGTGARG